MSQTELYQSVLKKLSDIPTKYLSQVDAFLSQLSQEAQLQGQSPSEDEATPSKAFTSVHHPPSFREAIKPIRKSATLDTLKREQHYQPIHKDEFMKKAQAVNIQEPLEDLLKMLD